MADTINTLITGIESSKDDIATSIEGKGVAVPSGTKLAGMSSLIDQISTMHGPASSVDGNLAAFDGTSGDTLKDSGIAASAVALDTNVVHKTGNENISGYKYFVFEPPSGSEYTYKISLQPHEMAGTNKIVHTNDNGTTNYKLTLPDKNGTLATTDDIPSVLKTGASNKDKYLHTNASTGALEWSTVSFTDTNYYAKSSYTSSNGTKIATGYNGSSTSTTYDLYAPNATASQAGLVTTGDQTFNGAKTFSGSIISEYIYGIGNSGIYLYDSNGEDSSLELTSSCASISGPSVSISSNGSGGIELSTAGNKNISLFSQNYSGTGKAYYKGDEIATVAGTRIEIVDLTTINS